VAYGPKQPLVVETIEVAPPRTNEVRIKVAASGVCHTDLISLDGHFGEIFPLVFGHEGAGIVESIGESVTSVRPGDHVIPSYMAQCRECGPCKNPENNFCDKLK
jgi:S-(hydroxymethyl)glutathione dehydrogenase/alcohol dehydrogenase